MPTALSKELAATRDRFVEAGGHTTQSLGFGRVLGQIYALLYLSSRPLCLDEIATELGVSKASVSTTVRQLQSWSAVRRIWVKGDRKDYYEAEIDFRAILRNGVLATFIKKLDTAGNQIAAAQESLQEAVTQINGDDSDAIKVVTERLEKARQFHERVSGLLNNPLLNHLL
jgi:DNA-binding transcriptional regulator GbsR (MarR family)